MSLVKLYIVNDVDDYYYIATVDGTPYILDDIQDFTSDALKYRMSKCDVIQLCSVIMNDL